ncbi:ATP binding protein of ABC transporter for sugars [Acidisarcina polymorpha]|uniref:ATP binding protein of ABC transporter for sugars n=1 Tax=Acidisarcina polymorpha TaxID=2211140 RepID=A0A2Z5FS66_9BACT|nr:ATP-binding cassette domain-containing protein [Acidisarcina polymorpha]AXC09593.1 ATP binding protein of ABC transporter for sugars [Acidisarcina polymorpha]
MPESSFEGSSGLPSLKVTALSLSKGAMTLGPASFTLPGAGCWWLAGVSGAGKSLLLESLAGFHAESVGNILASGKDVGLRAPEYRSIALLPQRWRLFPHWTVGRNLAFAANLSDSNTIRSRQLAEKLQVEHLLDRPTSALSGGETQRIALIQTLLSPARILLLDEPLSAVDAALQSAVLDLLQQESTTNQRICLIAAHRPTPEYPMKGTFWIDGGQLAQKP